MFNLEEDQQKATVFSNTQQQQQQQQQQQLQLKQQTLSKVNETPSLQQQLLLQQQQPETLSSPEDDQQRYLNNVSNSTKIDRKRCSTRQKKRGRPPKSPLNANADIDDDSIIQSQSEEAMGERCERNVTSNLKCTEKGLKPILNHLLSNNGGGRDSGKDEQANLQLQNQRSLENPSIRDDKDKFDDGQKVDGNTDHQGQIITGRDSLDENNVTKNGNIGEDSLKFKSQQEEEIKESSLSSLDRSDSMKKHNDNHKGVAQEERTSLDQEPENQSKKQLKNQQKVHHNHNQFGDSKKLAQTKSGVLQNRLEYYDPSSPQLHITRGVEEQKLTSQLTSRQTANMTALASIAQPCVKQETFEEQQQLMQNV